MKIPIYGEIIPDEFDWIYSLFKIPHFCPANLRSAIGAHPEDREIDLEINSPGGDVWSGFDAYSLLQGLGLSGYRITATVTAMAASAASTIMSACQTVRLSPVAQVMIHDPSTATYGNIQAHKETVSFLNSIKESIINGYIVKSKGKTSRDTFKSLMTKSTWLPAQQAVELGLADEIIGMDPNPLENIPGIRNAANGGALQGLLEDYCRAVSEGTMDEDPEHPVASVRALLAANMAGSGAENSADNEQIISDNAENTEQNASETEQDVNNWTEWAELRLQLERERSR